MHPTRGEWNSSVVRSRFLIFGILQLLEFFSEVYKFLTFSFPVFFFLPPFRGMDAIWKRGYHTHTLLHKYVSSLLPLFSFFHLTPSTLLPSCL
jgi:hypothetical protein